MISIIVFIFGIILGSFYNAVMYRVPNNISIADGRSICPTCKHELAGKDLVPFFSWLLLGGKCRYCDAKISWRYPFFELLTGFIFVGAYLYVKSLGYSLLTPESFPTALVQLILYCSFFSMLLMTTVLDIDHMIVSLEILGITTLISVVMMVIFYYPQLNLLIDHVLGGILGGVIYFLVYFISKIIYKKEAFGEGDVYLLAAIGIVLGVRDVALVAFLSFFVALFFIIILSLVGKKFKIKQEIPFGPYMCITAVIVLLFGDNLVQAYVSTILR